MLHRYVFRKFLEFIRNGILLWMLEPTTYCGVVFTAPTSQITLNLGLKTTLMQLSLQWLQLTSWLNWWSATPVSRRSRVRIQYKHGFFFRLSFRNCGSCVCNCDGLLSYHSSARSSWFPSIHDFNAWYNYHALWLPARDWRERQTLQKHFRDQTSYQDSSSINGSQVKKSGRRIIYP